MGLEVSEVLDENKITSKNNLLFRPSICYDLTKGIKGPSLHEGTGSSYIFILAGFFPISPKWECCLDPQGLLC